MPIYEFVCKKCNHEYEELTNLDPNGKYKTVSCPNCNSKSKTKKISMFAVAFDDPRTSSKWDKFGYRAGFNYEKAQGERREAERTSHMGPNPYTPIDDTHLGEGDDLLGNG